ncbi:hypothetical protein pb186bvf_001417 [Paramecium bursaria]
MANRGKPAQQQPPAPVQAPPKSEFDPAQFVTKGLNVDDIKRIKECFDIFDVDKSGTITLNELKNAIVALGLQKSAEEILNLIQDLDTDKTNDVDFKEFLEIFGFTGTIEDEKVLKDLFEQFTEGRDGITIEDFRRVNDLVGERYTENELKEMVQYADKNKDTKIDYDEFLEVVNKEYPNKKIFFQLQYFLFSFIFLFILFYQIKYQFFYFSKLYSF